MRLKYIELTLENCEVVTIDGKYIGDFLVDDISTSISRLACNWVGKVDWAGLGAKIIITNNDTKFVRELFKDWKIHPVGVRRSINRNGDSRKGKEVIITNYEE